MEALHKILFLDQKTYYCTFIIQAIHNMGYGTMDKIFLEYEDTWWPADCEAIQLVWTKEIPNFDRNAPHTKLLGGRSVKVGLTVMILAEWN